MKARVAMSLTLGALVLAACRGQTSEDPPIALPARNMHFQQRYNSQAESSFFGDHRTMRMPVVGTVSREGYVADDRLATGRELDDSAYLLRIPDDVGHHYGGTDAMIHRGQGRYDIFCAPCHGRAGDGNGMVFLRSAVTGYIYPQPANIHQDRLRHEPDGQLFATISNGIRNMPSYAAQIPLYDRWAIVSYVRALQLSQATAGATP